MPSRRARSQRIATAVALVGLVGSVAACGSRRSDAELLAAARGNGTGAAVGGSTTSGGATSSAGTTSANPPAGAVSNSGLPAADQGATGGDGRTGDAGGTSGPSATGAGAVACTGKEPGVTIGAVGEQSGLFGPFMKPIVQGLQTWVANVNAKGGVACQKITLISKDDGGDPSVHQSQVQELVEQDNVIALVGTTSVLTGNASVSYLTGKGVPVIGNEGGSEWFYQSPVFFPQMTTGNTALGALVGAVARVGVPQGKHNLGLVTCIEAQLCSSLFGDADQLAASAGVNLVYKAQASLGTADFTSQCQAAKQKGVEMMIGGLDTGSILRLLRNCQSVGFNPIWITGGPLVTPDLISDPRAEGFYVSSATDLVSDTGNAEVSAYRDAVASFSPGLEPSIAGMAGWTAGRLFETALAAAAAPTRAALLSALDAIQGNDLGGLTYPLSFTAGSPAPRVSCVWIGQVRNGGVQAPDGLPPGRFCQ